MIKFIGVLCGLLCLGRSALAVDDVAMTYENAIVHVPARLNTLSSSCDGRMNEPGISNCLRKAAPGDSAVVVFMHGCDGMNPDAIKLFRKLDVLFVAPDSFARPDRKKDCDVMSDKKAILSMRFEEARYASKQLRRLDGLSNAKLILAGFSEGASTTSLYPDSDPSARIILGWSCRSKDAWWDGIRGSGRTPVLSVVGTRDKYHQNSSNAGDCGRFMGTRPHSSSVLIEDAPHQILPYAQTEFKVREFIQGVANNFGEQP